MSRAIHATSVSNGGDYVAHRRNLLQKYASIWLLALHDQDIAFYALTIFETITQLVEEDSFREQTPIDQVSASTANLSENSIIMSLRFPLSSRIIRLDISCV
jgi:hypothetical protein